MTFNYWTQFPQNSKWIQHVYHVPQTPSVLFSAVILAPILLPPGLSHSTVQQNAFQLIMPSISWRHIFCSAVLQSKKYQTEVQANRWQVFCSYQLWYAKVQVTCEQWIVIFLAQKRFIALVLRISNCDKIQNNSLTSDV